MVPPLTENAVTVAPLAGPFDTAPLIVPPPAGSASLVPPQPKKSSADPASARIGHENLRDIARVLTS